jgi:hypothetical protein
MCPLLLEQCGEALDAFGYVAEAGSAWSLLHPAYSVVIPQTDVLAIPLPSQGVSLGYSGKPSMAYRLSSIALGVPSWPNQRL